MESNVTQATQLAHPQNPQPGQNPQYLPPLPPAEVNLRDYLDVLRRRKAIMLQTFIVVMAVGIITTIMSKPVYEAGAKLLVVSPVSTISFVSKDNPLNEIFSGIQADSVATQMEVLQS